MSEARPFGVHVPEEELEDLRRRLRVTRFIPAPPDSDWRTGVPVEYLRGLVDHWLTRFDWRGLEERVNAMTNLRVEAGGVTMHCVHRPAAGAGAMPIVLVHGWPGSFLEMLDLADELANPAGHGADSPDAFDVVVPSLPGFGYSDAPPGGGWTAADNGRAIADVMEALGYERFGIHAYDIGASSMVPVCVERPERVLGYHTTEPGIPGPYPRPDPGALTEEERAHLALADEWEADEGGYFAILGTRPQTLGHGLNDSPAGLAAWIVEKWWSWTVPPGSGGSLEEFLPLDRVLANVALYWHTQSVNSANWYYFGPRRPRRPGEQVHVPVGVALTTQPIERAPRPWAARFFTDIRRWEDLGAGGHFVTMERPTLLAGAIREFFRPLRG